MELGVPSWNQAPEETTGRLYRGTAVGTGRRVSYESRQKVPPRPREAAGEAGTECGVNRTCWCPWCGCEGEALNGIAGFCLRSGRLRAERVLWARPVYFWACSLERPIRGKYGAGTCARSREVGLEMDLKTGRTYPGLGQDQRAQSGFQRKVEALGSDSA